MIKTVVFPVAGKGSRLQPVTDAVPKELVPVYDTPLLQFAIDEARAAGAERLVFVTSEAKPMIEEFVAKSCDGLDVRFVFQDAPLGLGHAILQARAEVEEDAFAVLLPDDLILAAPSVLAQMAKAYNPDRAGHMVAAMRVEPEKTASYGILDVAPEQSGRLYAVRRMVEKPDPSDSPGTLAVVGRYILKRDIFDILDRTAPGAGDEIQLTDAISSDLSRSGVCAFDFDGQRFDCGHHEGLFAAAEARRQAAQADAPLAAE